MNFSYFQFYSFLASLSLFHWHRLGKSSLWAPAILSLCKQPQLQSVHGITAILCPHDTFLLYICPSSVLTLILHLLPRCSLSVGESFNSLPSLYSIQYSCKADNFSVFMLSTLSLKYSVFLVSSLCNGYDYPFGALDSTSLDCQQ